MTPWQESQNQSVHVPATFEKGSFKLEPLPEWYSRTCQGSGSAIFAFRHTSPYASSPNRAARSEPTEENLLVFGPDCQPVVCGSTVQTVHPITKCSGARHFLLYGDRKPFTTIPRGKPSPTWNILLTARPGFILNGQNVHRQFTRIGGRGKFMISSTAL